MSKEMTSTIALKHEHGVSFGTVDWINGDKLQCQVGAKISRGATIEMRMELAGWKHTVCAIVEVVGTTKGQKGQPPKYALKMLEISQDDQEKLETWLREREMSGTTDDPMAQIEDEMDDPFAVRQGAASEEETKLVMARYEERRRRVYHADEEPDPFGLGTETDESDGSSPKENAPGHSTGSLARGQSPNWLTAMEQ